MEWMGWGLSQVGGDGCRVFDCSRSVRISGCGRARPLALGKERLYCAFVGLEVTFTEVPALPGRRRVAALHGERLVSGWWSRQWWRYVVAW